MIDLLVAGGGPAGLATALYANRAGLEVAVLEPRTGPIDKACGEGLMPGALAALADLGIDPVGQSFAGIRYTDGQRSAEARFAAGPGRGVRRTVLHDALADAARRAGIDIRQGRVEGVTQQADRVSAGGLTARYLAAADGLHSPVARAVGLAQPARAPKRWGLRTHLSVAPWTDLVEVHWARHAEAYVTPVGPDRVGVAVLSGHRASYADQLAGFPALRDRLGPALTDAPGGGIRGAGPLRHRTSARTAGRVLLVGDAADYVDALTGEGISVALAGARALVDAVDADRPGDYEASWRRVSRRYRALTSGLLWATRRPPLRRALIPATVALPRVFGLVVDQLAR